MLSECLFVSEAEQKSAISRLACVAACAGVLLAILSSACLMCAVTDAAAAEDADQKLAVVNVSLVFEKYEKVPDVQRRIDAKYKSQKDDLQKRADDLSKRNKELEQYFNQSTTTEVVFDAIQRLRKDQFAFERDLGRLNESIQDDYTKEMRDVLTDIRSAVRGVAEHDKFDMVLRSPDTDDPAPVQKDPKTPPNPADADKNTYLALNPAQTVAQLVERFNRNPVLFGAQTVDLTQSILKKLNDDYSKRSPDGAGTK